MVPILLIASLRHFRNVLDGVMVNIFWKERDECYFNDIILIALQKSIHIRRKECLQEGKECRYKERSVGI